MTSPLAWLAWLAMALLLPVGAWGVSLEDAERAVRERAFERAAAIYRSLAEAGDPEAQRQLAALYRSGRGVDADPAEAVRWLRAAADAGHAEAQFAFATMLDQGRGVPQDEAAAGRWYRAAAVQGHEAARRRLRERRAASAFQAMGEDDLVHAAGRGETARVLRMLEATSGDPGPALLAAAGRGRSGTLDALLASGADPNARGTHRETALHRAARRGDLESVDYLLTAGASKGISDDRGATPLHVAARAGSLPVVERLLVAGAPASTRDVEGRTALDLALRGGHGPVAERLRQSGASQSRPPERPDRLRAALWAGTTASSTLAVHARRGDQAAVAALLEAGVSTEARAEALREAAAHGHLAVVRSLIDRPLVGAADASGATPIWLAARAGHAPVVRLLVAWGASLEAGQPLVAAARGGHLATVEVLLGAQRNAGRLGADEALRASVASGSGPVAEALLAAGADPARPGEDGNTALCAAAALSRVTLLDRLLDGRSTSAHLCEGGVPLLHRAAGSAAAVRTLLARGAAPDVRGPDDTTALLVAAGRGSEAAVRLLLDAGADVDARGPRRRTALMIAAERGHGAVVDRLIASRAKAHLRDAAGDTALELATRAGHEGVRAALEAVPAKPWF